MPEVRPRRRREPGGAFSPCAQAVRLDHRARCVSGVFKFMPKRMTIIDGVLRVIGGATILLSLLVAAAMFVTWSTPFPMLFKELGIEPSLRLEAVIGALPIAIGGTVVGCLILGFAAHLRLLDEIRMQGEIALMRDEMLGGEAVYTVDDEARGIERAQDGTFLAEGRAFKTLAAARAYLGFLDSMRK